MYYEIGPQWIGTSIAAWATYLVIMDSCISATPYKFILKMRKELEQWAELFDPHTTLKRKREIKQTIICSILTCRINWVNILTSLVIK